MSTRVLSVRLETWSIARSLRLTRTRMILWTRVGGPFAGAAPSNRKSQATKESCAGKASVYYLMLRQRLTLPSLRRSCTRDWSRGRERLQTGRGSRLSLSFSRCATEDWRRRLSLRRTTKCRRSSHLMRSSPGSCSARNLVIS